MSPFIDGHRICDAGHISFPGGWASDARHGVMSTIHRLTIPSSPPMFSSIGALAPTFGTEASPPGTTLRINRAPECKPGRR
jgi:hypothetical protein